MPRKWEIFSSVIFRPSRHFDSKRFRSLSPSPPKLSVNGVPDVDGQLHESLCGPGLFWDEQPNIPDLAKLPFGEAALQTWCSYIKVSTVDVETDMTMACLEVAPRHRTGK